MRVWPYSGVIYLRDIELAESIDQLRIPVSSFING